MKAISYKRLGSVPGCLYLQAHDVGEAVLEDGSTVTITWGGNFNGPEDFTGPFRPHLVQLSEVWEGDSMRANYEILIPGEIAAKIIPSLLV